MSQLIPELHDVLKLAHGLHNKELPQIYQHYQPNTATWNAVLNHHTGKKRFPRNREMVLLAIADRMAAALGRHSERKIKALKRKDESQKNDRDLGYHIHKLWHPVAVTGPNKLILSTQKEIIDLLNFMKTSHDFISFEEKYIIKINGIPECKNVGVNITSLRSHMVVTGKFYRILKQQNRVVNESTVNWDDSNSVLKLIDSLRKKWSLHIALLEFDFHQQPFRTKDLAIFDLLKEVIKEIKKELPDQVLMDFDKTILLVYDDPNTLEKIAAIAEGLWFKETSSPAVTLEKMKLADPDNPEGLKDPQPVIPRAHYDPNLPSEIAPDLCEICQMAPATATWHEAVKEGRKEELCEKCYKVRQRQVRLLKLSQWSESEEGVLVAWVHHALNYKKLVKALKFLFGQYLMDHYQISSEDELKEVTQLTFSLIEEFSCDYREFVAAFNQKLKWGLGEGKEEDEQDIYEPVNDWLACIRLARRSDFLKIVKAYQGALETFFPQLMHLPPAAGRLPDSDIGSPFSLRVAICPAKFPFFQVWRQFQQQEHEVEICLMGHGGLVIQNRNLDHLVKVAEKKNFNKTALFRLAELARVSEELSITIYQDRTHKDAPAYGRIREMVQKPLGLDFQSMLTLAPMPLT